MKKIKRVLFIFFLMAVTVSSNSNSMLVQPVTVEAASSVLNKTSITLSNGQKVQLKSRKKVSKWISNNSKIASVSKNGIVTAKRNGKACKANVPHVRNALWAQVVPNACSARATGRHL